ncbi:putative 2-succinyl-5-enolpyruvyl-6-hydroxy-3-cyclohexene-1-carboxylic-acid synthase [Dioscorea sansibarensis]
MLRADLFLHSKPTPLAVPSFSCRRSLLRPRLLLLRRRSKPSFQVYSGLEVFVDEVQEMEELDSLVEISETRTFRSALSYRNGADKIRQEVENLKVNPPSSASGVLRLQVRYGNLC